MSSTLTADNVAYAMRLEYVYVMTSVRSVFSLLSLQNSPNIQYISVSTSANRKMNG